jgi:hypothetical protein
MLKKDAELDRLRRALGGSAGAAGAGAATAAAPTTVVLPPPGAAPPAEAAYADAVAAVAAFCDISESSAHDYAVLSGGVRALLKRYESRVAAKQASWFGDCVRRMLAEDLLMEADGKLHRV